MQTVIHVKDLSKSFSVKEPSHGILGAMKALFCTKTKSLPAIQDICFQIAKGERVAFIGPNGAGKSTTIKMLTGILYPTSGTLEVLGMTPWKNRRSLGYQIGTVFGQRTQLWYHLPASDTFDLLSKIYEIDPITYRKQSKELIEAFEIGDFLHRPVRQLSLGQRMRCEIVASLLHNPKILFLDEPTIGLDIQAKLKIRSLLNKLSYEHGTTLFLTSHDTADIEQVCDRVIILDQGKIIQDCSLKELKRNYVKTKVLNLVTETETLFLDLPGVKTLQNEKYHFVCEVDLTLTPIDKVIQKAISLTSLKDVTIEDPSMEEIIRHVYRRA